jgi:hypothetical protein
MGGPLGLSGARQSTKRSPEVSQYHTGHSFIRSYAGNVIATQEHAGSFIEP